MDEHNPRTVNLEDQESVEQILQTTILGMWELVSNLTRIQRKRHTRYRVTIFGSARAQPGSTVYEEVKKLAAELTSMGCDIITGGGPGLMQAANEGAADADAQDRHKSVGIRVALPFEQQANPFVEQVFEHRTFFSRLHHFVLLSDAFIVTPGGIGTLLETAMIWQLLQVHHMHATPLVLVGSMWAELVTWARHHMFQFTPPLADVEDMAIPSCVASASDAMTLIRQHYDLWVSGE
jgi:uncharacterized protein (TIGR00730 family)